MAWTCTGTSNAELVDNLVRNGLLTTPRVIEAFKAVDRRHYVRDGHYAYVDSPSSLGYNATISAPHMHAHAVENLEPFLRPGHHVLDIGSGSGYLLSIFHKLVCSPSRLAREGGEGGGGGEPSGTVLGIDHLSELVSLARSNLARDPTTRSLVQPEDDPPSLERPISNIASDGRLGAPRAFVPRGGYSAIHVGAAAPTIPEPLIEQLARPGRMFIPVGPDRGSQSIIQVDRGEDGTVSTKELFGVNYIPLTDAENQRYASSVY
ncbi:hypothetical protein JCM10212_002691 [Sporobolomyces blumeae]